MAYKYHTQKFLEDGVDFKAIFADKQKKAGDQLNLSFNLLEIVDFIKKQSEDFTRQDQHLMDLDAAVKKIVEQYVKVTEAPKDKDAASIQPKPNYEVGANKPLKAITTPKKVGEEVIQEPVTPVEQPLDVAVGVVPVSPVVPAAEKLEEAVEQVIAAKAEMTKADWSEKIQSLEDLLELDPDDAEVADKVAALKDLYELEFDEAYGSSSSSSERNYEQEMAEENDKQLSAAGFDVSKLTAEQKDVILEPSNAPENYAADGEISGKAAEAAWTGRLTDSGLNKEQIKRAKNMQLGTKMEHGGAVGQGVRLALAEAERKQNAGMLINTNDENSEEVMENWDDSKGDYETVHTIESLYSDQFPDEADAISKALMEKYPSHFEKGGSVSGRIPTATVKKKLTGKILTYIPPAHKDKPTKEFKISEVEYKKNAHTGIWDYIVSFEKDNPKLAGTFVQISAPEMTKLLADGKVQLIYMSDATIELNGFKKMEQGGSLSKMVYLVEPPVDSHPKMNAHFSKFPVGYYKVKTEYPEHYLIETADGLAEIKLDKKRFKDESSSAKAALQNLVDRDLIKDKEGDHYDEVTDALEGNDEEAIVAALKNLIDNDLIFDTDADAYTEAVDAVNASGQTFEKGGETSSLKVENQNDLEAVAKYMTKAVNKHSWDLKDLIHYFEVDNNFDYKVRAKIWEEMNMYEAKKTYDNILKLLTAIVEGNGKHIEKMASGGSVSGELYAIYKGKNHLGNVRANSRAEAISQYAKDANGDASSYTAKHAVAGDHYDSYDDVKEISLEKAKKMISGLAWDNSVSVNKFSGYYPHNVFRNISPNKFYATYGGGKGLGQGITLITREGMFNVDATEKQYDNLIADKMEHGGVVTNFAIPQMGQVEGYEDGGEVEHFSRPQIGAIQTVRLVEDAPKFTKGGSIGGKPLYTKAELLKKYAGKFIDTYPHHHTYTNPETLRYETVYEVRGVSSKIKENYESPEEVVE